MLCFDPNFIPRDGWLAGWVCEWVVGWVGERVGLGAGSGGVYSLQETVIIQISRVASFEGRCVMHGIMCVPLAARTSPPVGAGKHLPIMAPKLLN